MLMSELLRVLIANSPLRLLHAMHVTKICVMTVQWNKANETVV